MDFFYFYKSMFFANDILFFLPEIYLTCLVIISLLVGTFITAMFANIAIISFGWFTLYLLCLLLYVGAQLPVYDYFLLGYQYLSDPLNYTFKGVLLLFLIIILYTSMGYFFHERIFFLEYFFFIGFFILSAFFLLSANDFSLFYVVIELQALILYTLATLKRYNIFSAESGLKYFVLGAFSSGLLLFGISLFYGFAGLLNFYEMRFLNIVSCEGLTYYGFSFALVFILVAFLFKMAGAPFHIWVPDVYEGSPTPVVLFFAVLPKLAIIIFLIRFYVLFLSEMPAIWHISFFTSGILSVLWGTFAGLNQFNIKRLYAYSAIVNVGYLLLVLSYGTIENLASVINYLLPYLLATCSVFFVILLFRKLDGRKIRSLVDYRFFFSYNTLFAGLFSLVFFSLAGIPPLVGFFTKFFLFKSLFTLDLMATSLVFVVLIISTVSAFYYIRVVRFTFFTNLRFPIFFLELDMVASFLFVAIVFFLILFVLIQPLVLVSSYNLVCLVSL